MALFITFEGGEGSGKSTQAKMLQRRLQRLEIPSRLIHEPGVTPLGKKVARLLKWTDGVTISPVAELLLFNTARAQLVAEVIRPALMSGTNIICDRYADSTTAYQGYGRGIDLPTVATVNYIAISGINPDITFLLDIPVEPGLARKLQNKDRFEMESLDFHQRVREGYLKVAEQEPERFCVIDAGLEKKAISGIIWDKVNQLLPG